MIETHGLRRIFKSRKQEVVAVDGIDLMVEKGEIFGFLGPNGAGKTTTLRMLSTLINCDSELATHQGHDFVRYHALDMAPSRAFGNLPSRAARHDSGDKHVAEDHRDRPDGEQKHNSAALASAASGIATLPAVPRKL